MRKYAPFSAEVTNNPEGEGLRLIREAT